MSVALAPPPAGLPAPKRGVRRMNKRPLFLGIGIATGVIGLAWYVVHSGPGSLGSIAATDDDRSGGAADVLATAPSGVIPAASQPVVAAPAPAVRVEATPAPTRAVPPAGPAETEAEIAVRRRAWDSYSQALDEQRKRLMAQAVAGLTGDMVPVSAQPVAAQPAGDPSSASTLPGMASAVPSGGLNATGNSMGAGGSGGWGAPPQQRTDFWGGRQNPDYQQDIVTAPVSEFEIKAGDVIEAVLVNGLNSDSKGEIVAQVTRPVLDYATGTHILIPQGARLIGYYNTDVAYGQNRLEAGFDRVIFPPPGSESLRLVRTPGSDQEGAAGFSDITDNHLGRIIFNALLGAAFSAGIQLSQPAPSAFGTYSPGQIAAGAVGQQANQVGNEFVRRGLDIPPTQRIRNGYHFTILVKQDIAFSRPWEPSPPPSDPIHLVNAD